MEHDTERKKPSLREESREHTRQRMLEAAYKLFVEVGYEHATMEMIAREAEVGRATLFKYFPGKEKLILPLAQQLAGEVLRPRLQTIVQSSLSTRDALKALFQVLAEEILSVPHLAQAFVAAFNTHESREAGESSGFTHIIAHIISIGQQRGEVRQDLSAETIANFVANLHTALFVETIKQNKAETYMLAIEEMLEFVGNGLHTPD